MTNFEQDKEIQELFDSFLIETEELLDSISSDLMVLESNAEDIELLNRLFRSFHTIKGTSSFMGVDSMASITHQAEDVLNKLRRSELKVNLNIIDVLLEVHDWLKLLLDRVKARNFEPVDYSKTIEALAKIDKRGGEPDDEPQKAKEEEQTNDSPKTQESALEAVLSDPDLVKKPGDFTQAEIDLIDDAFLEVNRQLYLDVIIGTNYVKDNISEATEKIALHKKDEESEKDADEKESKAISKSKTATSPMQALESVKAKEQKTGSETIRVDINRVEALMNLSGELVLGRNRISQISESIALEGKEKELTRELLEATAQIDFVTSEIQTAVMRMRMVPVAKLYQKAPRMIRDLSKEFNKKINLVVKGEETEIDRGIIDELNNPLVHLLRNSCDHGIESTEERLSKGKPADGTVTLDAEQEGNAIVLRITDDGKGLDTEKILDKAIQRELITQEQAAQMSKREIFQLIFQPGFSTSAMVTNVSGRGVGMDVVKTNIQNLKGIIDIESEEGKFTTFIIKLPLTLAIIQGLLVRVGTNAFAVPLSSVIEVVAFDESRIYSINHKEVIRLREDILPLVRMNKFLNLKEFVKKNNQYIVVVGIGLMRVGLIVEELLGQQEIVIKSLGDYLGTVKGLAGSTILGDGKVVMIIDVPELVELCFSNSDLINFVS